jgi:hypothetical protein
MCRWLATGALCLIYATGVQFHSLDNAVGGCDLLKVDVRARLYTNSYCLRRLLFVNLL